MADFPFWLSLTLAIATIVVPVLAVAVSGYLGYRAGKKQDSEQRERDRTQWINDRRFDAYMLFLTTEYAFRRDVRARQERIRLSQADVTQVLSASFPEVSSAAGYVALGSLKLIASPAILQEANNLFTRSIHLAIKNVTHINEDKEYEIALALLTDHMAREVGVMAASGAEI